ncbi:translocation/assembly module TamB, partial [Pseudoxanthomonas sp. SGD-10]
IQDKVKFRFEEKRTIIEDFEISNSKQLLAINGAISSSKNDLLEIVTENFRLSSLSQLTESMGVELFGIMNGSANLSAILGDPDITSDITIDSLRYNQTQIGKLELVSAYDNEENNIKINSTIIKGAHKTADISGIVDFKKNADNLNLDVELNGTEVIIFEPFVKELVSDLKGQISSDLKVTGKFNKPQINGNINLINAGFTVNYLKTPYIINDRVTFANSVIGLENVIITDKLNNTAVANGTVDFANPANPDINVVVRATNFLALNTTAKDNQLYYGTALATGNFTFRGPTDAMNINIKATTEEGTVMTIPLNSASTIGNNDFIIYTAKDTTLSPEIKESFFKGLTMEFELTVDHNSTANIITEVGNLSGKGDGLLRMRITSLGDFEMFGDYIINEGKFEFTANNVINKTFEIRRGGTIRWTGSPEDAGINLNAVYSTRANLLPLYQAAGRTLSDDRRNERVLAEAEMLLTGSLLNPEIRFGL